MLGLDLLFSPAMIVSFAAIIVVGAIAHGAIGFGFPLISTPLIALLIDVKTAVLITVVPNIVVNVVSILRGGNWRASIGKHWPMPAWVVLGTLAGTQVLLVAPPELLQVLLAAMIVVFLWQDRIRQLDWGWVSRRPGISGAAFGIVAGLFSGAVNVAAPPLVIYFMLLALPPLAMTQILNLCFMAGKTVQGATLSLAGPGSLHLLIASLPLTVLAIAALWVGIQLQKRMSPAIYFKILRVMLIAFVILLLGQAAIELGRRFWPAEPGARGDRAPTVERIPRPDHVVVVVEENKAFGQIVGNSAARYLNRLGDHAAVFTKSFAVTHPSQPNYLALFSGSTHGILNDECPVSVSGDNLANQLQRKGLSFAIYSESLPLTGYDGCVSPDRHYARKHNPAVNWQNKNLLPAMNMPFTSFPSDYTMLPTLSIIVPNLLNDMHDGRSLEEQIARGDAWLKSNLDAYVQWARANNSLLIVTWDEDDGSGENRILTMFIGPMVWPGTYSRPIDHYSVLRTLEAMYDLPPLGNAEGADAIRDVWVSPVPGAK